MLFIACFLAGLQFVAPQCTFPAEFPGNWKTSTLSTLTFTSTTVGPMFTDAKTLTCFQQNDTRFLLRSDVYNHGPIAFRDYTCIDLRKVSDTKYMYHELTAKDGDGNRLLVVLNSTDGQMDDVCTLTAPTSTGMYSFMMKDGTLASSVIANPDNVMGTFNATMPGCEEGAVLDVCTDPTRLDFNYTECGSAPFTDEMVYHALHYTSNDVDAYVTLFIEDENPGGTNPFIPFSCMAVGTSGGNLSLTIAPGDCQVGQDSVNVTAPGVAMELSKESSCAVPTTVTTTPSGTVTTANGTTTAPSADGTTAADSTSTAVVVGPTTTGNRGSADSHLISVFALLTVLAVTVWII